MGKKILVGITGASGAIYGIRTLQALAELNWETHLILTQTAGLTIKIETDYRLDQVKGMASAVHDNDDFTAPVASGSFSTFGMIVAPCSIKSLSAVANSFSYSLLTRAADVTLKERRPLALMVRETPLHPGHLRLMSLACEAGAMIVPPIPAFYSQPKTLADIVDQSVGRTLALLGIDNHLFEAWK